MKFVGPQPQKETLKLPVQKLDQQVKCGSRTFQNELIVLTSLHQVLLMLKLFVVLTVLHIQKKQLAMTYIKEKGGDSAELDVAAISEYDIKTSQQIEELRQKAELGKKLLK